MKKNIGINAVLNAAKQFCSILFSLITIPYVSRILGVTNYGKISFSSSIIGYFSLLASLGISSYAIREGALVRGEPEKLSKVQNEIFTLNFCSTIISYCALIIFLIFCKPLAEYRILLIIQSFGMLFTTLGTDWVNSIHEDYLYITVRYILVQVISIVAMLCLVKTPSDYIVYAGISTFASIGGDAFNIFYIKRKYAKLKLVRDCNPRKHLKPIFQLFFSYAAMTIYVNSDVTMLGILVDDDAVGIYNVSTKIYIAIKQVLNATVMVMVPQISSYIGNHDIAKYKKILRQTINPLLLMLCPCAIGLFCISSNVIYIISGTSYLEGTWALKILSLALIPAVIGCYFSNCVLLPNKMEKHIMWSAIFSALINICLNFFMIPLMSYNGAAITTLISEIAICAMMGICGKKYIDYIVSRSNIVSVIIGCIGVLACCYIIELCNFNVIVSLLLSVVVSAVVYFLALIGFKNEFALEALHKILNKCGPNK